MRLTPIEWYQFQWAIFDTHIIHGLCRKGGWRGWEGDGEEAGTAHPFEISPPPPAPRCLERVGWERDVQLTHPFETTGGGGRGFSRKGVLSSLLYQPFVYLFLFIYLFIFCLFIYFEFNPLFVYSFIHHFACLASIKWWKVYWRVTLEYRFNGKTNKRHSWRNKTSYVSLQPIWRPKMLLKWLPRWMLLYQ